MIADLPTPSQTTEDERYIEKTRIYGCGEKDVEAFEKALEQGVEFDTLVAVIDRITDVQNSIDKIAVRAAADIKRKREYLDYLMRTWAPHIQGLHDMLKQGKRTLKLGNAGVIRWEKQGGFFVSDRDELVKALDKLTDRQLQSYGAKRTISFNATSVLKEIASTGEALPGISYVDVQEYASFRIGSNAPWSPTNLKKLVGKAIDGAGHGEEDDE